MTSVKRKTKRCTKCNQTRLIKEFSLDNKSPDKHNWWCKKCANKQAKIYNDRRREKHLPFWICPRCGEKIKLTFFPKSNLKRWKKFRCPECKFLPYDEQVN